MEASEHSPYYTSIKQVLSSSIFYRRLRLPEDKRKAPEANRNSINLPNGQRREEKASTVSPEGDKYATFEEWSKKDQKQFPISQDSVAAVIVEMFYFIVAWKDILGGDVNLPKCKFVFKRQGLVQVKKRTVNICVLLEEPPKSAKKPTAKQVEDELIKWLGDMYQELFSLTEGRTNASPEEPITECLVDFKKGLKQVYKIEKEKGRYEIRLKKGQTIKSLTMHMEHTSLFRTKAILVRFAMFSPYGLTTEGTNTTLKPDSGDGANQHSERVRHINLLIRIRLQREFYARYGEVKNIYAENQKKIKNEKQDKTPEQKLKNINDDMQTELRKYVKDHLEKSNEYILKNCQFEAFFKRHFGYQNPQRFLEQNLDYTMSSILMLTPGGQLTDDPFWLFRKTFRLDPRIQSTSGAFRTEPIDFQLSYSEDKDVIEVILLTDIYIKKENLEFLLMKNALLKEYFSYLDIASAERTITEKRTCVSLKLYDRHPKNPRNLVVKSEQPKNPGQKDKQPPYPPVMHRILTLMDEAAMLMACLRDELTPPHTLDDYFLNMDTKRDQQTQHYLNIAQIVSQAQYAQYLMTTAPAE